MTEDKKWVLITGASSGIGRALAFEFAAKGFNLFLTARNEESLRQVAGDCSQKLDVETRIHPADLSDSIAVDKLLQAISALPIEIEILVNNAVFGGMAEFAQTAVSPHTKI